MAIGKNDIIIATHNQGKVREFKTMFKDLDIDVWSLAELEGEYPDIAETGTTFIENATLKAEGILEYVNRPVMADDSGIEIDALNGRPGVYSARFAGLDKNDDANNEKVLQELASVPEDERTARFKCVLAFARPGKETLLFEGACEGKIAPNLSGEHGFGYDPLFIPNGYEKTMGEIPQDAKNKISHRHMALQALDVWLKENDYQF